MSIPLINSNEYAHDSFISIKKQIYSDENNYSLTKPSWVCRSQTDMNTHDSFITIEKQLYFDEN